MSKWNEQAVRHVRTSNNATGIERAGKTAASSLWDGDAFEPGFWDYSGVDAGWQVTAVDLGDPALSMGMVDEDGRFAWQVKNHLGAEVASGASGDFDAALNDAEMAYRIASDEDMDFMSKRTALREIRSLDEDLVGDVAIAPDSQMPMDTGVGNVGTIQVEDASENNDPDFERNEFTAANITPQDFKHEGEGWYQYEAPDGSSQVSVMEMDSDEWEVDVSFSDGTYQDTVLNSWNDVDAVAAAVEFYNRVASTCRTAGRRTASMWDSIGPAHHVVAGWNYDNLLEGYVAEGSSSHFACICGSNVETPGYGKCTCGKIWNSYTISSQGSTRVVCREIPDRGAEVLLATRKKTAVSWTAQEALDQRGETADHYRIPDKVLDCKECWNSAEANAHDESADPNGYDYGMPVIPMALDYLSNGDLYCEEHYL